MGKLNSLERTIGLEFEFSNPKAMSDDDVADIMATAGPEWVRDGSLREGGRELVTCPMKGDQFIEGISGILAAVQKFSPEIDSRCGYHVHVGAGDFSWTNLRNLILAWCAIEKDVFAKLVRADRKKNRYCIPLRSSTPPQGPSFAQHPWQMTKATLAELATITDGGDIENYLVAHFYRVPVNSREFKLLIKNKRAHGEGTANFRYSALNLHSWWYRHTVEFRLKEGTLDIAECLYWPLFCGWFVENIAHMRLEEVQQISNMKSFLEVTKLPKKIKAWVQEKMEKEQDPEPVEMAVEEPRPSRTGRNIRAILADSDRLSQRLPSAPQAAPTNNMAAFDIPTPPAPDEIFMPASNQAGETFSWQAPPSTWRSR